MSPTSNGGRSASGPTKAQARAVRAALRSRNRQLDDDFSSIQVFLGLSGNSSNDGPPVPGSSSGQLMAQYYGKVANEMRTIAKAVANVKFGADDKNQILAGLSESAKAFDARSKMVSTLDPAAIKNALTTVESHEKAAAQHNTVLQKYFGGSN